MRNRKALSLLETVFCCALLGIFLSIVSQLVVSAYRTQALYRDRLERQRGATVFLQQLVRRLQGASLVKLVSSEDAPVTKTSLTGDGLVVTYRTANGDRTRMYYRDDDKDQVICEQFGDSFVFNAPVTWVNQSGFPHVEVRRAKEFSIEPITVGTLKLWRLELVLEGVTQHYVRDVRRQPTEGL